jgi:YD repeat-containing protein
MSQTFHGLVPGAWYAVSFAAAQRPGYGVNPVNVRVNGGHVGTFTPSSRAFSQFTTAWFQAPAASATIELSGSPASTDSASGIDNVQLLARAEQQTTRFAYDGAGRLRFVVGARGAVTEHWYDGYGQLRYEAQHTDRFMDVGGMDPSTPLHEWQVNDWRNSFDKTQLNIVENRFDARGNVAERISYGGSDWHGSPQTGDGYTHQYFTYDQTGQLLNKTTASLGTEHFSYDGLGRLIRSTDLNGGATSIVFNDGATQTVVTLANGLVQTSSYNKAGDLVAHTDGGDFVAGGTATTATTGWAGCA